MLKKLIYLLLFLVVGSVLFYFVRYKTGQCICNKIPSDAESVVYVNARNLEKYIIDDLLSNPSQLMSSKKSIKRDTLEPAKKHAEKSAVKINEFLNVPSQVFFFRRKGKSSVWESSNIQTKDIDKAGNYFLSKGFQKDSKTSGMFLKGNQAVELKDGTLRFTYFSEGRVKRNTSENPESYLSKGDKIFDIINEVDNDVIFVDNRGQVLTMDFMEGEIEVHGSYDFDFLKPTSIVSSKDDLGQLSANFDVKKLIAIMNNSSIDKFENFTKLRVDSLEQYWNGQMLFVLNGFETASDTIKTYEYDDDFNKIEVKKVESTITPNYIMKMEMTGEGVKYMNRNKAIVSQEGKDVLAIMPLVKTYCSSNDNSVSFYTHNDILDISESKEILNVNFNIKELMSQSTTFSDNFLPILTKVEKVTMSIDQNNRVDGSVSVSGNKNALIALIQK